MTRPNLTTFGIVAVVMLGLHLSVGQAADKTTPKKDAAPSVAVQTAPTATVSLPSATVSISDADQISLKNAELKALKAQDALKSSPAYTQFQQAMSAQQDAVQSLVKKYHINPAQYTLCDGQGAPPCSETKPDTMEFRLLSDQTQVVGGVVPPPAKAPAPAPAKK